MWKNLAPKLVRQRVIIEGTTRKIVKPEQIKDYLLKLSKVVNMVVLSDPVAYSAHEDGYGGFGYIGKLPELTSIVIIQNLHYLQLIAILVRYFLLRRQ